MTDEEYKIQHQKKNKQKTLPKEEAPSSKSEIKRIKMEQKQAKILEKARKKYGINPEGSKNIETIKEVKQEKIDEVEEIKETNTSSNNELSEKLSKLSKEQQEALLKLLER